MVPIVQLDCWAALVYTNLVRMAVVLIVQLDCWDALPLLSHKSTAGRIRLLVMQAIEREARLSLERLVGRIRLLVV